MYIEDINGNIKDFENFDGRNESEIQILKYNIWILKMRLHINNANYLYEELNEKEQELKKLIRKEKLKKLL